jgi:hypothetical protein
MLEFVHSLHPDPKVGKVKKVADPHKFLRISTSNFEAKLVRYMDGKLNPKAKLFLIKSNFRIITELMLEASKKR